MPDPDPKDAKKTPQPAKPVDTDAQEEAAKDHEGGGYA